MAPASKKARSSAPPETSRALAVDILDAVERRKAYADILLDRTLRAHALAAADRALLTELVYGTLRWRGRIDAIVAQVTREAPDKMDGHVRNLLRVTLYQIFFLDRIPAYAAVNEAVEIAKRGGGKGAAGFVNAIARRCLREKARLATFDVSGEPVRRLAATWSHPEWLVRQWLDDLGEGETEALLKANNQAAPLVVRANRLKISRADLIRNFTAAGVDAAAAAHAPEAITLCGASAVERLPGFEEGLFFVQSEAAQLVSHLLDPKPGERVWDASAAPGGKATHVAELMDDRGEVVATDIAPRGIARIEANVRRLGIKSVRPLAADAAGELTGELARPYDRILADLPCTGLGTLRSHPEAKWLKGEEDVRRLSQLQRKILDRVGARLQAGGVLVYSTCTLTRAENEDVVEDFLRRHEDYTLENAADFLPPAAQRMVRGKYFMALPHRDDTDGFFAARLTKGLR